jgi:hypothetical protein
MGYLTGKILPAVDKGFAWLLDGSLLGPLRSLGSAAMSAIDKGFAYILDGNILADIRWLAVGGLGMLKTAALNVIPAALSLGAALLPIVAVVLLVAGAITVGVLLFTKYHKQGQEIVNLLNSAVKPIFQQVGGAIHQVLTQIQKAWDSVQPDMVKGMNQLVAGIKAATPVFQFLGTVIGMALSIAIKIVGALVVAFIKALPPIIGFFANVFQAVGSLGKFFSDIFHGNIGGAIHDVIDFVGHLKDAFLSAFQAIGFFVVNAITNILHAFDQLIQKAKNIPFLGGVIGAGQNLLGHIPHFAQGGYVTRPTLALVGEGREAEAILPNSVLSGLLASVAQGTANNNNNQQAAPTHVHLHIGDREVADVVLGTLNGQLQMNGMSRAYR